MSIVLDSKGHDLILEVLDVTYVQRVDYTIRTQIVLSSLKTMGRRTMKKVTAQSICQYH